MHLTTSGRNEPAETHAQTGRTSGSRRTPGGHGRQVSQGILRNPARVYLRRDAWWVGLVGPEEVDSCDNSAGVSQVSVCS